MPSTDDRVGDRTGDRPRRRQVVAAAGSGLLGLLAGCAATSPGGRSATPSPTPVPTPTATGTYGDLPTGPRSYPDRPADLSPERVRAYVRDVEHARTYNVLYEPDMTDSSVDCRTAFDREAHGGYYALATCTGYANYPEAHADWGQAPALYFVSEGLTVRVADYESRYFRCTDVFASADPAENFAAVCEGGDAAYRVYNVHPDPHTVSVTVEFLGSGGDETANGTASETGGGAETVLEREYTLAPTAGVEQESVTYRRGVYRLTATLDGGPEATYRWELETEPTAEDPSVTVLVTPAGGVTVRRVPFPSV